MGKQFVPLNFIIQKIKLKRLNKISPHTYDSGFCQKDQMTRVGREKSTLVHYGEMYVGAATMENSMEFFLNKFL